MQKSERYALSHQPDRTAVILVNWRGVEDTLVCLAGLASLSGGLPFVIVVDNGSGPEDVARLRGAQNIGSLIESPINLGFGGGCNLGIREARARGFEYVWLLNNDARPDPDALAGLLAAAGADQNIAAVGSVVRKDDGSGTVESWGGGKVNFWSGQPGLIKAPGPVNYVTGSSALLRLSALAAVGDFDEAYFLYWEDTDLSFRLRAAGWRLAVAPESRVYHKIATSAAKAGRRTIRYYNEGAKIFFGRYAPVPLVPVVVNFLYRFFGQLRAREFGNAWVVLCVMVGF